MVANTSVADAFVSNGYEFNLRKHDILDCRPYHVAQTMIIALHMVSTFSATSKICVHFRFR